MRLDKFLANNTELSRSDAQKAIRSGRVSVNKDIITAPTFKLDVNTHYVELDGLALRAAQASLYIMLHKPTGFVSATSDSRHPCVLDLIADREHFLGSDEDYRAISSATLQIVGRLDLDTSGLLLLTNDGHWNHRICSPRNDCKKTYLAELAEPLKENIIDQFKNGLLLKSETKPTQAAALEIIDPHRARVSIAEGRYHQVKRMFAACENRVINLHREKIGDLKLDSSVPAGYFRCLSELEAALF